MTASDHATRKKSLQAGEPSTHETLLPTASEANFRFRRGEGTFGESRFLAGQSRKIRRNYDAEKIWNSRGHGSARLASRGPGSRHSRRRGTWRSRRQRRRRGPLVARSVAWLGVSQAGLAACWGSMKPLAFTTM